MPGAKTRAENSPFEINAKAISIAREFSYCDPRRQSSRPVLLKFHPGWNSFATLLQRRWQIEKEMREKS